MFKCLGRNKGTLTNEDFEIIEGPSIDHTLEEQDNIGFSETPSTSSTTGAEMESNKSRKKPDQNDLSKPKVEEEVKRITLFELSAQCSNVQDVADKYVPGILEANVHQVFVFGHKMCSGVELYAEIF